MRRNIVSLTLILALAAMPSSFAQDLYMKDTPADTGVEPNPDTGPMWVSDDIWVRTSPDAGYQPYPFPEATPPWVPLPHEDPEYRDPKYSVPNYVYVRVHNRGSSPSTGTERLRVYWAKASTGLAWPTQWVDYLANTCGPQKLYGAEITKPRKNAATATAAERDAYRDAILAVGTNPSYVFFGGASYWQKQEEVHKNGPANRHGTAAFLPWHREFVNRYEALLQEASPTVKLLYWDWTTDPRSSTGGFDLDTSTFMGASGAGTGGASIGAPFNPPSGPTLAPPAVTRDLGGNSFAPTPTSASDATVLANGTFPAFHPFIETTPHNSSHVYLGGSTGDMSFIPMAAQDPFFFLLHANVDRLWAQWQRDPSSLPRLDPATTYGSETGNVNITTVMQPWDGTGTAIQPWTAAGGYIVGKLPADPSVVSPPIYDTAPLTIPVLQPNEAVVIQIPWYPPNPADFSCFGGDQGHFCLVARIETSTTPPFGMTTPETADINANTNNNNNVVWKNVTVVDNFPGAGKAASILIRNPFTERVVAGLRFADTRGAGGSFFRVGHVFVELKPELFKRWREGQGYSRGVKVVDERTGRLQLETPDAFLENIRLEPGETFSVDVGFELPRDYPLRRGPFPELDLIQTGAPGKPDAVVGGQRFALDLSKLVLVAAGGPWRYRVGADAGEGWTGLDYDDSSWKLGKAELGFGGKPVTVIDAGPPGRRSITTYFRRAFDVANPSFYRNLLLRLKRADGAVVYLNGKEVHRVNLPAKGVGSNTLATRDVKGLEEEVFFPVQVAPQMLRQGRNVLAAEVHLRSPRSDDLSFDLELSANRASGLPPEVAFASPPAGAMFQTYEAVPVRVEALDPDGRVRSVSLYADGKLVGRREKPPYTFRWTPESNGAHRLRAVAVGDDRQQTTAHLAVSAVASVPPAVTLGRPLADAAFESGEEISVTAQASAHSGAKVVRVEFWIQEADFFMSKKELAASAKQAPYAASIRNLKPGHYMLWAVAVDDRGNTSQSLPVHVMVGREAGH
ncbi:MAG TPA: tyrosinase family protein [Thermoanaerobaculia bacterium]